MMGVSRRRRVCWSMTSPCQFWDALAPHHAAIEDSYLDRRSLRRILPQIRPPVLVVGAGQGLLVAELRRFGLECKGVDSSVQMNHQARLRRGIDLVQADARSMPFSSGSFATVIYATGVIDSMREEAAINQMLMEGRRVLANDGKIFVAFYRLSPATEIFLTRLGLLGNQLLHQRDTMEFYRFTPWQALAQVAARAKVGLGRATAMTMRSWACSSLQEKRVAMKMQKLFAKPEIADALLSTAPELTPYRTASQIQQLFDRLSIPVCGWNSSGSCHLVQIGCAQC